MYGDLALQKCVSLSGTAGGKKYLKQITGYEGWDGKVKGTVQPMDVYAYTLDVEFFDGTKATKKGDITLIR